MENRFADRNNKKIIDEFPGLYAPLDWNRTDEVHFPFECGAGWFETIHKMTKQLAMLQESLDLLLQKELPAVKMQLKIDQLKEKYGELTIYWTLFVKTDEDWMCTPDFEEGSQLETIYDAFNQAANGIITDAEKESENICEYCGIRFANDMSTLEDHVTTSGWISNICRKCALEKRSFLTEDLKLEAPFNGFDWMSPFYKKGWRSCFYYSVQGPDCNTFENFFGALFHSLNPKAADKLKLARIKDPVVILQAVADSDEFKGLEDEDIEAAVRKCVKMKLEAFKPEELEALKDTLHGVDYSGMNIFRGVFTEKIIEELPDSASWKHVLHKVKTEYNKAMKEELA